MLSSNGLLFQDILPFILCMLIPVVAIAGAAGMYPIVSHLPKNMLQINNTKEG